MIKPIIVDVAFDPQPVFTKTTYKAIEIDLVGAFSNIPIRVVLAKDVRSYVHVKMEEFGHHGKMLDLQTEKMINEHNQVNPEFDNLVKKNLNTWNNFPNFYYDEKWVKIAMSKFHDGFIWLDQTHLITKDVMRAIIGLSDSGEILKLKFAKNKIVMDLISATFDKISFVIDNVCNPTVKYLSMMVINKIYFKNRENSISTMIVHMAYEMAELNKDFNLCEILHQQFLENFVQCQKKKHSFKFRTLPLCILFYFLQGLLRWGSVFWSLDTLVAFLSIF